MVTALLADIVGAGIVEKTSDKDHAMTVEEKYAENPVQQQMMRI